jgi:hypothetical protein
MFFGLTAAIPADSAIFSELWGIAGERWAPHSRLPDFSYAGYRHGGEVSVPSVPVVGNVRAFGAVGDGEHDDTEAFLAAIAACEQGAILIPEGRYRISEILEIRRSGVVLRGEGPTKSILYFPKPLNEVRPNWGSTTGGRRTSNYSWSGGFVRVKGDFGNERLADVSAEAQRGDTALMVSNADGFTAGQRIRIQLRDDERHSLVKYLYSGDCGDIAKIDGVSVSQIVTIRGVEEGKILFDRPLRFDVKRKWNPSVHRYAPTVEEVGIEQIGFEFPLHDYGGHFTEMGFNAAAFTDVSDCWIRDVHVRNCDSGFFLRAHFSTLSGIRFQSERAPDDRGRTGHHGLYFHGSDNLLTDFSIDQLFIHDISVGKGAVGNVISNGTGADLTLDHHKQAPYENLFTHLDVGKGSRVWLSGGGGALGKHCGGRGTFWNITANQPIPSPPDVFGPSSMNFVALVTDEPSSTDSDGIWFEAIPPERIEPKNIHEAQLRERLRQDENRSPEENDLFSCFSESGEK